MVEARMSLRFVAGDLEISRDALRRALRSRIDGQSDFNLGPSFCCPGSPGPETAGPFGLAARGPVIADNNGDPWENWAQLEALHFFLLEHSSWETGVVQDFANQDEIANNLGWAGAPTAKEPRGSPGPREIGGPASDPQQVPPSAPDTNLCPGILERQEGIMSSLASTGHEYGDLPRLPHIIRGGWVTGPRLPPVTGSSSSPSASTPTRQGNSTWTPTPSPGTVT